MTLEDETAIANVILREHIFRKFRRIVFGARMVGVEGILQKENEVIHVSARRLVDLTPERMGALADLPSGRTVPGQNLWRHPRNVRVLPKRRNFH